MTPYVILVRHSNGVLAQLGEHLPCTQGVIGSIPISSTIKNIKDFDGRYCFEIFFNIHIIFVHFHIQNKTHPENEKRNILDHSHEADEVDCLS